MEIAVPTSLRAARLPAFSLQPLVENAIKHGIAHMLDNGYLRIGARTHANMLELTIEDNAGTYYPRNGSDGLGMNLVDRRIKARYGHHYGITVTSEPEHFTRVQVRVPLRVG
ncbi:hypothetical protein OS42_08970 [Dickeya oryzae]